MIPDTFTIPLLFNSKETAEALRCCPSTLTKLRKNGKLRAVKLGKSVRFRPSDVSELIAANLMEA